MDMNERVLREQLLALLRGKNAHLSFDDAVADFPMAHINTKPPHVGYTPWHLLEHVRIAQWDILEFVRNPNHTSPEWPRGYWPYPNARANDIQWQQTIEIAVSPIIGGQAVKGPAAKIMQELGMDVSPVGVASHLKHILTGFVFDAADMSLQERVENLGLKTMTTNTLMRSRQDQARLAREVVEFGLGQK